MKKQFFAFAAVLLCLCILMVCIPTFAAEPSAVITFTDSGSTLSDGASGLTVSGTVVTISSPGVYEFTGACSDGTIAVAKGAGDVDIVLNGLDLTSKTSAAISCKSGTSVTVTAAEGTQNSLSDTDRNAQKPKSVINASGDVILDGKGSLTISGNNKNGVKADGSLTVKELTLTVNSKDDSLSSDNILTIESGIVNLVSDTGECLKSDPDEISAKTAGKVVIKGGSITAEAKTNDAVKGRALVEISGGDVALKTNGGSNTVVAENDAGSYRGVKSDASVIISGGSVKIDSADDAVKCDADITVSGGELYLKAGGDAFDAEKVTISAGAVIIDNPASGKRALDYNTGLTFNGGIILATETTNDAAPVADGGQSYVVFDSKVAAGTLCAIALADDTEPIAVFRSVNDFSRVIFSSPEIDDAAQYALLGDGSSSSEIVSGKLYKGVDFTGSELVRAKTAKAAAQEPTTEPTTLPANEPSTETPTQPTTQPTDQPSTETTAPTTTEPTTQSTTQPTTQTATTVPTTAQLVTEPSTLPTTEQPTTVPVTTLPTTEQKVTEPGTTQAPTSVTAPPLAKGDLTGDGTVNAEDARICLRIAAKLEDVTDPAVLTAADVDGSGAVNAVDARIILRVAAKLETF